MKHLFTSEKKRPSAKTIYFIKKLAYTYRALNNDESHPVSYTHLDVYKRQDLQGQG